MDTQLLTINTILCQCEIYEICRKCAPTPEDYECALRQREEILEQQPDGSGGSPNHQ